MWQDEGEEELFCNPKYEVSSWVSSLMAVQGSDIRLPCYQKVYCYTFIIDIHIISRALVISNFIKIYRIVCSSFKVTVFCVQVLIKCIPETVAITIGVWS